jgi:hypothetical protein
MEINSHQTFSVNRGMDLYNSRFDKIDLSFLPLSALLNCNGIVLSLLMGKDIHVDIENGANSNGITEKSPFLSPLVWVGLVHLSDWEQEKQMIRKILLSKIDCNYIGLCGFNLFHLYLVQSIFNDFGFQKLKWWVDKPMVDCNIFSLSLHDRPNIKMLHPSELITRIVSQYPIYKKQGEKIILYLLSRGMSCRYLGDEWKDLADKRQTSMYLRQRLKKQQNPKSKILKEQCLPTPQMNELEKIPHDQHLLYTSSEGLSFRFHASYMDPIVKTHRFPFTMEAIPPSVINKWLCIFEKKWIPREEFATPSKPTICQDLYMEPEKLFIHLLNSWILPIYPYSRIIMLSTFPLTERMFEYMCLRMRSGMFHLSPFHKKCQTSWKNFFLWACYDCIHEFLFANQIEEIVSQLEIFYMLPRPFLEEFPNVETFILMNSYQPSAYNIYSEEFDYTMCQVYILFKKMAIFMNKE